jgi:5-methylcytosine-specific restriction protein A
MSEPTPRLRGRAAVAQRKRRLQRTNGLCERCLEKGKVRIAKVVDHIKPLAFGGSDEDGNTQNLCSDCDAVKTAYDSAKQRGGAQHPDWLEPSAVPVTIVCGPPCSGKTTYVNDRATAEDLIISLDDIMMELDPSYVHWSGAVPEIMDSATRVRNALLGSLADRKHGKAWFIVSAPSPAERDWWHSKLGGEIVLLHPGADECKNRAIARGTPRAQSGIDEWERKARMPWSPKMPNSKIKPAIGLDGWPTES